MRRLRTLLLLLFLTQVLATDQPHLVRFSSYAPQNAHSQTLRAHLALHPSSSYTLVPRQNPSSALPTDFLLIRASPATLAFLATLPVVRSVEAQTAHPRSLAAVLGLHSLGFVDHAPPSAPSAPRDTTPGLNAFGAGDLWARGFLGEGVRVAVFDTGLGPRRAHLTNVVDRTDWTEEGTTDDRVGHGTFVAGLIAGSHPRCPGIAPGAEILTFRVFAGAQMSYTSWFLDAFNYALQVGVDVLNLSIGGPDFADQPFTEKVNELTAAGVVVVSAIGNDGPLWGSLNNPADMMDVVGVGGVEPDGSIAAFSSRGMTTHELSSGFVSYGRVKPDLVTYSRMLYGQSHSDASCKRLSGTSVASPVVAGAIALLASTVPKARRRAVVNPASIKRALIGSARRLPGSSMYEQGSGLLDMAAAADVMKVIDGEYLSSVKAREVRKVESGDSPAAARVLVPGMNAILFPSHLDLTAAACPLMWPHCAQPLFQDGALLTVNVTVLNPGGATGFVESAEWIPGKGGEKLQVDVTKPRRFWPWAGGLGVHLSVSDEYEPPSKLSARLADNEEVVEGYLRIRVVSKLEMTFSVVELPVRARISPPPPREKRLLWDMFHSLRYPPGYVPRDSLAEPKEMLDWLGDHPHTNFHSIFRRLQREGFYVDVLEAPLTCLSASSARKYGAVLLVDSEDFFADDEVAIIEKLVVERGLGLVVASEWYNSGVMSSIRFEDDNTRSWWIPVSSGANLPSLNTLLAPFGIAFGNVVMSGTLFASSSVFRFESGNSLVRFPVGGELLLGENMMLSGENDMFERNHKAPTAKQLNNLEPTSATVPVGGLTRAGRGAVAVYGDTNCIDTAYRGDTCHDFFVDLVTSVAAAHKAPSREFLVKVFSETIVLSTALETNLSEIGQPASPSKSDFVEILRPHSRTLDPEKQSPGSALKFRDTYQLCRARSKLMEAAVVRADVAGARNHSLVLPELRFAEPLQSTSKYYATYSQFQRGIIGTIFYMLGYKGRSEGVVSPPSTPSSLRAFGGIMPPDARGRWIYVSPLTALLGVLLIIISVLAKGLSSTGKPGSRKEHGHLGEDSFSRRSRRGGGSSWWRYLPTSNSRASAGSSAGNSLSSTASSASHTSGVGSLKYLGLKR